jgi:predicted HAD superfamily Cof-like phosphohydrolase
VNGWAKDEDSVLAFVRQQAQALMRNSFELVKEFHNAFGHPVAEEPTVLVDANYEQMRLNLILEELEELFEACGYDTAPFKDMVAPVKWDGTDIVAVADALADLEYVVNGMAVSMGIDLPAVVREVHRSNMTKLGEDGRPIYREDGKILKGPGYEEPQLMDVLGL